MHEFYQMSSTNSKRKTEPWMTREVKEAVRGKYEIFYRLKKNESKEECRRQETKEIDL